MYNDDDRVEYLSQLSGFSKRKCRSVLQDCNGNLEEAAHILTNLKKSSFEVFFDKFTSLILDNESGRKLYVFDNQKVIMSLPVIILIIVLIVVPVPSWIIGGILLIFYLFDMDFTTKSDERKKDGTVEKKEEVTIIKESDTEDFDEITIE